MGNMKIPHEELTKIVIIKYLEIKNKTHELIDELNDPKVKE